jgi:hypothetical protein
MTQYVDGEEEQLELTEPLVANARIELARLVRTPIPDHVTQLLRWLARESFRLGYQHAHERNTVNKDLWPEEEVTR